MGFASEIQQFAEKTNRNINQVRRGVALDLFTQIIQRTPVDTGRARSNWQTTINTPASGNLSSFDRNGSNALSQAARIAATADGDDTIWLVNNLPYIIRLEYGYSDQAPQGMLRLSVQQFRAALRDQIARLDK